LSGLALPKAGLIANSTIKLIEKRQRVTDIHGAVVGPPAIVFEALKHINGLCTRVAHRV
jgi:hypothetical protein